MQTFKYSAKYILLLQSFYLKILFLPYGLSFVNHTFLAKFQFFHVCLSECPPARHKERHLHIVFFERLQNAGRVFIPPCRVKAERHLLLIRLHTVDGQFPSPHGAAHRDGIGQKPHNSLNQSH